MLEWAVPEDVELTAAERRSARTRPRGSASRISPPSRKPSRAARSAGSTPGSGPSARVTGSRPAPGRRASASPSSTDGERDLGRRGRRRWRPGGRHRGGLGLASACTSAAPCSRRGRRARERATRSRSWPSATAIAEVSFDPWRASPARQELQQRGVRVSAFPQTDARMIPASHALHRAVVERRLVLPADETLSRARRARGRPPVPPGMAPRSPVTIRRAEHRRDHRARDGARPAENQPQGLEVVGWF